ncbi:MAG: hypothetical protein GY953_51240 [bacterium]|nr:hypothetical protein [bacterium]
MGSQREAMKPDLEALRVLAGQLNEAKRLNLRGGNNDAEVGNLLMKVERQRMKIEEIKKQNHEANLATVKSWGPRAESGLGTIQRAARLRPAIEQAARLGLVRVPEPRDRRR